MQPFMNKDFLLHTDTAKTLYHEHAVNMPIIDFHCHINPAEIVENRKFENITQAWLGGDHYKWRLIRTMGVEERFITGDASDREKFQKFAETLPKCIGNPIYHWSHLELQRYFGTDIVLSGDTAQEIWDIAEAKLKDDSMRVRGIIEQSRVQAIGTTDDPIDDLKWHKALREDAANKTVVSPTMRPDKAMNIDIAGFADYIAKLATVSGVKITSRDDLKAALLTRIDFFNEMGCRASDHGLDYVAYRIMSGAELEAIFQKGLRGEAVTMEEAEAFKTDLMLFFGREFAKRGWVMQLHYGVQRNTNDAMFERLGPDTGFDAMGMRYCGTAITGFLNALAKDGLLPKTVLFSINPHDDAMLGTIIGCFQGSEVRGKIQHGVPWWFNDTKQGMENQLITLSSVGVLGTFIGMLTDSRSFLSYARHEYFRRILCNQVGVWVEGGEYPNDKKALAELVEDISYRNAARYFGYDVLA
ncbi:MAG: glucuronate isomerase [Oscillospiraceae bacterium]|nr:glucuronate isomerase [Oscillospiraceae bacterium]